MKKVSFLLAIVLILSFTLAGCSKPAEQTTGGDGEVIKIKRRSTFLLPFVP